MRAALFLACLLPFWVSELVRDLRLDDPFARKWRCQLFPAMGPALSQGRSEMLYNDASLMTGLVYTSMFIHGGTARLCAGYAR